jgi:hypothetical protein
LHQTTQVRPFPTVSKYPNYFSTDADSSSTTDEKEDTPSLATWDDDSKRGLADFPDADLYKLNENAWTFLDEYGQEVPYKQLPIVFGVNSIVLAECNLIVSVGFIFCFYCDQTPDRLYYLVGTSLRGPISWS